ncbi:hypothetical protein K6T82_20370 [Flavobacterium sp. 17A]|uniref:Uncharacterized protein n=1 Tax=Flavobacterium potami TaxID=2872310 RepID=A0A9X1HE24_9FLAO|nr:hypothetical protein [Flavobacterium potami]MBZ4037126.1 hypothetical protein [Flavobacterium potami]
MQKKFTLEIDNPCSENFDKMIPNISGSFCSSCMKNVIDLSKKTNSEVAKFVSENKGLNICARLRRTQLEEEFRYNETSKINNLKYAAVLASVLLTSNVSGQEKESINTEMQVDSSSYLVGKVASNQNSFDDVSIMMKGRFLDAKTNKPFNEKTFPKFTLSINGSKKVKVNSKTGDFSIPITILNKRDTLEVIIQGPNHYLSKRIPFSIEDVKDHLLLQDIIVDEQELSQAVIMVLGGLGINYLPEKNIQKT